MVAITKEVQVDVDVEVDIYRISDEGGNDVTWSNWEIDEDLDISIDIEGYVVDQDEYDLLQRASEITPEQWDLLDTYELIS